MTAGSPRSHPSINALHLEAPQHALDPNAGPFAIHLCSSTTPMALEQPDQPELKRFTFFVSKRREEGRERFRLSMGFFPTLPQAEEWLAVVREFYPGAWMGPAEGKNVPRDAQAVIGSVPTIRAEALPPPAPAPARKAAKPNIFDESNVRQVLAELDKTDEAAPGAAVLTDTQVINLLEGRSAPSPTAPTAMPGRLPAAPAQVPVVSPTTTAAALTPAAAAIPMLKPGDMVTRRALQNAVRKNEPVSFAVQLQRSEQPICLHSVPPLAIFTAYTLYTVEGHREGRRWYGLRLGFFSDSHAAKQVAHYVRSEFAAVAVVPVSPQEHERALEGSSLAEPVPVPRKPQPQSQKTVEFKFIDEVPALGSPSAGVEETKALEVPRSSAPRTLEEKLAALGADQFEIDDGRGELLNDTSVRHLHISKARKDSPFSRLLDRLSEKAAR